MLEFFSVHPGKGDKFLIFSSVHILVLVTLGAIIASMLIFRKNLRRGGDFYRYLLVIIALVIECLSLVWVVSAGNFDLKTSLPLELCEISLIVCILMLAGKSYRLFEIAYFWGFIGSSLALIFPSLHTSYHHFQFWAFMLTHALNIIALVYMMAIEKFQPTRKSIWVSFIITNIYMLFITAINYCLGSNYYFYYVFKKPAPSIPSPFMYTHSQFGKILILEGLIMLALQICFLPFEIATIFKKKFPHKLLFQ